MVFKQQGNLIMLNRLFFFVIENLLTLKPILRDFYLI